MIIPYSTDAPVYHWPIATGALIGVNTLVFLGMFSMPAEQFDRFESWMILTYGNFNPITWVTSNYVHGDFVHLIMNMINLWVFGLIVEGKVGWLRFLVIYHGIGFVQCGVEQTLTILMSEGGSYGASAIIYGLMAIAMVWAPANHIECQYIGFGRIALAGESGFEISVYMFVGISLIMQFGVMALRVAMAQSVLAALSSELLHLMGAALGAGIGIVMLQRKFVDCEGWDVFSVWQGKHQRTREQVAEDYLKSEEGQAKVQQARDTVLDQIRQYVAAGAAPLAWGAYKRGLNQFPGFQLPENDLLGLIHVMRKAGMWDECISLMVVFLSTYPHRDAAVRLALAQIMLDKKQRGLQALKVLQKIDKSKLAPQQLPTYEKFTHQAQSMANDDPYEVAAEDW